MIILGVLIAKAWECIKWWQRNQRFYNSIWHANDIGSLCTLGFP